MQKQAQEPLNEQPVEGDGEDPHAEELRVLLRRLYGPVGDQPKFEFANNNDFYLAHALIQTALFSVKQKISDMFGTYYDKGCINYGPEATPITLRRFKEKMKQCTIENQWGKLGIQTETSYFNTSYFNRYHIYNEFFDNYYNEQYRVAHSNAQNVFADNKTITRFSEAIEFNQILAAVKFIKIRDIEKVKDLTRGYISEDKLYEEVETFTNLSKTINQVKKAESLEKIKKRLQYKVNQHFFIKIEKNTKNN
jgi:hypothetical protein